MKVEVTVLGSPSLIVLLVSVDVKQHWTWSSHGWVTVRCQALSPPQDSSGVRLCAVCNLREVPREYTHAKKIRNRTIKIM